MTEEITVAVSGYFDPLHVGHLEMIRLAKQLGTRLVVIVNNDKQAALKKGKEFMPFNERIEIVKALKDVDDVFPCIDEDKTVCKSLEKLKPHIFAQGGDRKFSEVPETPICKAHNIKMVDGLGAKVQSSSELTGLKQTK
jgi:cytidyltransferase-like protein